MTSHSKITCAENDPNSVGYVAPKFDDVMIDIETMSLHPHNALILSIGMVEFDPSGKHEEGPGIADLKIGARSLILPNIEQQLLLGREVSAGTQEFWRKQSREASAHWTAHECGRINLAEACQYIEIFCRGKKRVWANGTQFDLSNLVELNRQLGECALPELWHYQAPRDMRTFCRETPQTRIVPIGDALDIPGVPHEPVYDCISQSWQVWSHYQDH